MKTDLELLDLLEVRPLWDTYLRLNSHQIPGMGRFLKEVAQWLRVNYSDRSKLQRMNRLLELLQLLSLRLLYVSAEPQSAVMFPMQEKLRWGSRMSRMPGIDSHEQDMTVGDWAVLGRLTGRVTRN